MKKSSEKRFNIAKQPAPTCPMIDSVINSITNIGDLDENNEFIELDNDFS